MADDSEDNKYFDVAGPGKTTPDPTSRPLIVGHRSILKQDPMMADNSSKPAEITVTNEPSKASDQEVKKAGDSEEKVKVTRELNIKPPDGLKAAVSSANEAEAGSQATKETKPTTDPSNQADKSTPTPSEPANQETPEDQEVKDETSAQASVSSQAGVNEVAKQVEAKKIDEKAVKEAAEKQTALEKLITEKKYFVPIGEKKRRRNTWVLLLVVIIAAVVGGYLAVDADLIKVDVELPVDLIKKG